MKLNELLSDLKEESIKNGIPIIKDDVENKIIEVIRENNIKNILEIGSATGYSSIVFANINDDIRVVTIEKDKKRYLEAKANISNFNLDNRIKIYNNDANELLIEEDFIKEYKEFLETNKFDMLFIDGAKGQYLDFIIKGEKHIKKGGYIIADNVLFRGYVLGEYKEKKYRTAVNRLKRFLLVVTDQEKYETEIYYLDDGLSISKIK